MPNGLGVGFELEVSSGADASLDILRNSRPLPGVAGTMHSRFHQYHCECDECEYDRKDVLFGAQQDCTADGEFISKIFTYGSKRMYASFDSLQTALVDGAAGVDGAVGNHVHVRRPQDRRQVPTDVKLGRLFLRYQDELENFAAASFERVRRSGCTVKADNIYQGDLDDLKPWRFARQMVRNARINPRPAYYSQAEWDLHQQHVARRPVSALNEIVGGSYLRYGASGQTYEFRLWNSTKSAWRMALHVGLSVGMTRAAMYGPDDLDLSGSVIDTLKPWLDKATMENVTRQIDYRARKGF
mgnify:CR=1 FL=1